ncbi:BZIP transcription factor [Penicillium ucsense]|uniref:BZIP transcription factor n=1 Tax=Penicillium ucsense TaxID=2839758 RepID=A0A8J8W280_9EURO|nr:BZIP transcription factor [Penicillium ucsense]KAF7733272.1 BZIP transcription factor [Penicillium ucsense]
MSSSSREGGGPSRRRESRSGSRKVSSLSAEQLERKRAMDREAQRSIRQRTKEHIEQLEQQVVLLRTQVDSMRSQNQQFDDIIRQNATLQDEIARLKTQLSSLTGPSSFTSNPEQTVPHRSGWDVSERPHGSASAAAVPTSNTIMSPQFPPPPAHQLSTRLPRQPSSMSVSSRSSHPHEWQQSYSSTRSSSIGDSSDPEFPPRMEAYALEGHLQQPGPRMAAPTVPLVSSQTNFGGAGAGSMNHSGADSSFGQAYQVAHHSGPGDGLPNMSSYHPDHRTMPLSMAGMNAPSQGNPTPPYQPASAPYRTQHGPAQQRDPSFSYPWNSQS